MTMTYAGSGVDYDPIDRFKRMCQAAAVRTAENPKRLGFRDVPWSRGESAYLLEQYMSFYGTQRLAFVEEGLGTKELVTAYMRKYAGLSFYRKTLQCSLAMVVNDIATLALPLAVSLHFATGSSDWFNDEEVCRDVAEGYADACMLARCVWGCGETPVLKGVIAENAAMIGGSAIGIVPERAIVGKVEDGNVIIILESSGIHANGLTLARKIAEKLPKSFLTEMPDGRMYGEALLDATHIYSPFVEDCLKAGIRINYAVNITGHGWRKFMRANGNFVYRIDTMPKRPSIFGFLEKHGPVARREMFANLNEGAGFALYVPADQAGAVLDVWEKGDYPYRAFVAGGITASDRKSVVIPSEGIAFETDELQVR
jgi:phosphoribosylformylglycinamidine cyclo-ligase